MKPVGKMVLIEQHMKVKQNKVITLSKEDESKFDVTFKVLALGKECPKGEVEIGSIPVISSSTHFQGTTVVEDVKDEFKIVHTLVYYDDILAVE